MNRLPSSTVFKKSVLAFALLFGFAALSLNAQQAQELVFRNDGQLAKDGKASVTVPVQVGQQLTFRIASLDFAPAVVILINGENVSFEADDGQTATKTIRVRSGTSAVIQISAYDDNTGSFQVRVFKQKENPPLGFSGVTKGTITAADPRNDYDELMDFYPLTVKKGQRVFIGVASEEGDALLRVELPDGTFLENDDSVGTDSRLIVEAKENGTWLVGASILLYEDEEEEGFSYKYNLYARELPAAKTLAAGANGTSGTFVNVATGIPLVPDTYTFTVPKAGIYKFRVNGTKDLMPGVQVKTSAGKEFIRRPGDGEGTSAELRYYFRAGVKLDITADALPTDGKTTYNISVVQDGDAVAVKDGTAIAEKLGGVSDHFYLYKGKAGEYIEFLIGTEDFDTVLKAVDEPGQELSWDDYFESEYSYASFGRYYFEKAGDLLIVAGSYDGSEEGDFDFTLTSSASGKIVPPKDYPQRTVLVPGKPLFTRLIAADPKIDGETTDEYVIELKTNEVFTLSSKSLDFDGRLAVLLPDGSVLASNDDFEGSLDPTVEAIAPRNGKYIVQVQTYSTEHADVMNTLYTISFDKLGTVSQIGQPNEGYIGEDADYNDEGEPYASVSQRVRSGQKLYIVASSDEFDPRLELYDTSGKLVAENADYGNGTASRVIYTPTRTGNFEIRVIDGSAEEGVYEGSFTLTVYELK